MKNNNDECVCVCVRVRECVPRFKTSSAISFSPGSYSDDVTFKNNSELKKLKNELLQYQSENIILRNSILALHSEVYGARLAAKYLDKELAGRIQQLQLLGREMRTDVRDKLWRQLESEILLHRHKTVIRACRNRTNHEFISADSRILNLNRTNNDGIFLKNGGIFRRGGGNAATAATLFNSEENSNRRKKYDAVKKSEYSDSGRRLSVVDASLQKNENDCDNDTTGNDNNVNNFNKNNQTFVYY